MHQRFGLEINLPGTRSLIGKNHLPCIHGLTSYQQGIGEGSSLSIPVGVQYFIHALLQFHWNVLNYFPLNIKDLYGSFLCVLRQFVYPKGDPGGFVKWIGPVLKQAYILYRF